MKKEMKSMKKMQSFAMVPVMVIAGILAIHMMFAVAYIAPAIPMA
jgi:competence protein ComGC